MEEPKMCWGDTITVAASKIVTMYAIIAIVLFGISMAYVVNNNPYDEVNETKCDSNMGYQRCYSRVVSSKKRQFETVETAAYVGSIIFPLEFIACILVRVGMRIRKPILLHPFVIWTSVCLVTWIVLALASIANIKSYNAREIIYGNFVGLVVGALFMVYSIHIVRYAAYCMEIFPTAPPLVAQVAPIVPQVVPLVPTAQAASFTPTHESPAPLVFV